VSKEVVLLLFYADPSGSSLLMQILAPAFVILSVMSGKIKKKIVSIWEHLSRQSKA